MYFVLLYVIMYFIFKKVKKFVLLFNRPKKSLSEKISLKFSNHILQIFHIPFIWKYYINKVNPKCPIYFYEIILEGMIIIGILSKYHALLAMGIIEQYLWNIWRMA